jgi:hypothetical protein
MLIVVPPKHSLSLSLSLTLSLSLSLSLYLSIYLSPLKEPTTISITTFSIMTFSITTFSITIFSITTFSITIISIAIKKATLRLSYSAWQLSAYIAPSISYANQHNKKTAKLSLASLSKNCTLQSNIQYR